MALVIHTNWRHVTAMAVGWVIVTGAWFKRLSDLEKRAVICHEECHIVRRHALQRWWWIVSFQWSDIEKRCRDQEHEADAYAVARGHADGLVSLLKRGRDYDGPLHPRHSERIARIRAKGL